MTTGIEMRTWSNRAIIFFKTEFSKLPKMSFLKFDYFAISIDR